MTDQIIPAAAVDAADHAGGAGWREKGIEYKSPEYWAYLQDRAGRK